MVSPAFRNLPVGLPKLIVSTVASVSMPNPASSFTDTTYRESVINITREVVRLVSDPTNVELEAEPLEQAALEED